MKGEVYGKRDLTNVLGVTGGRPNTGGQGGNQKGRPGNNDRRNSSNDRRNNRKA